MMPQPPKPVVLCILDGWGIGPVREHNAPALAQTPAFDALMATCPHATLTTFGPDVGLPRGQMGNSEFRSGPYQYRRGARGGDGPWGH